MFDNFFFLTVAFVLARIESVQLVQILLPDVQVKNGIQLAFHSFSSAIIKWP